MLALVFAGCGSVLDDEMECPSPNRSMLAVVLREGGGGAAGWGEYSLVLQPINVAITDPPRGADGSRTTVLRIGGAQRMHLRWEGDDHLAALIAYDGPDSVLWAIHQYPMVGDKRVSVRFQEVDSDPHWNHSGLRTSCESGALRIDNFAVKVLRR